MAIPDGHKKNFETLRRACKNNDLALLECTDRRTGAPVMALCAMMVDGEAFYAMPLAKLFDGNPYEELLPPRGGEEIKYGRV